MKKIFFLCLFLVAALPSATFSQQTVSGTEATSGGAVTLPGGVGITNMPANTPISVTNVLSILTLPSLSATNNLSILTLPSVAVTNELSIVTLPSVAVTNGLTILTLPSTAVTNALNSTTVYTLDASQIAASTTNATAEDATTLVANARSARVWLTLGGDASTTNAGTATTGYRVWLYTSPDNTTWDTDKDYANIKLAYTNSLGAATNTISDWFVLDGAKYIRIGRVENTFLGGVSNISVKVSVGAPQ